jgi:hypothetical protein
MSVTGHETAAVFKRYTIVDTNLQDEGLARYGAALETSTTTERDTDI